MQTDQYHILKHGLYYRPNSQGYTSIPREAGIYTKLDAEKHCEMCSELTMQPATHGKISKTELEIIRHMCAVGSNKMIAIAMDITENTVKVHVRNILRKLEIKDRTLLAVYAVRKGMDK